MTCIDFVDLVTEYLEGALDAETRRRFESHIQLCPGCEVFLDQIRHVVDQAGRVRPEDLSQPARERLLDAFADWRSG